MRGVSASRTSPPTDSLSASSASSVLRADRRTQGELRLAVQRLRVVGRRVVTAATGVGDLRTSRAGSRAA